MLTSFMDALFIIPVLSGWLSGLIINYLADVLPFTRKFSQPACQQCGLMHRWSNYLLLKNCQQCGHRRGWRTYAVYILAVAGGVYLWVNHPADFGFWLSLVLLTYLGVVLVIDLEHRLILHPVSIFGAFLGFLAGSLRIGPLSSIIGGAVGFGIMFSLYYLGEVFMRFMAKRRGEPVDEVALGFGDVNLAGVLGLILGWQGIIAGLLFAILAGGLVSLIIIIGMLILRRYQAFYAIPYAPYLILGALVILFR